MIEYWCKNGGGGEMRRMHVCQILSPDPLSASTYTEQSSHSVRVSEEASVCGMISCVCPCVALPVGSCWQALVCVEMLPPLTAEIKHFRSQLHFSGGEKMT